MTLTSTVNGGSVTTFQPNGKELVELGYSDHGNGGMVNVFNKTGEAIVDTWGD